MGRYLFDFYWIILSIATLGTVSTQDYVWHGSNDDLVPNREGNSLPAQGYLSGQINYARTGQKNVPKSCLNHEHSEEMQIEQRIVSPSNRRSSTFKSKNPFINYDLSLAPDLRFENNIRRSNIEEPLRPQFIPVEYNVHVNRISLEDTKSTPSHMFVEENLIETTAPVIHETTPSVSETPLYQEVAVVALESEEPETAYLDVAKKQFMNPAPVTTDSQVFQDDCADKNKNEEIKPPRRFLIPANYFRTIQHKNVLNVDGNLRTNNKVLNIIPNDDDSASTFDDKSTANEHNVGQTQNIDRSLQQTNENMVGLTGNILYTFKQNGHTKIRDPAKGEGISYINKNTRLNLMDFDRVCYACSTANNPRCWVPDKKTTVKYCRKGDNACVTKTFGSGDTLMMVRNCAKTCNDEELPGLVPNYQTCSICLSDLCNGSHSINVYSSILALPTSILIILATNRGSISC